MASSDKSIKIHEHCLVPPPSAAATPFSVPLTFFDLHWLRFHPVERIFFYSLPLPHSDHSSFFDKVVPKLKTSLSHTLQHFLPLAGNIVWPSDSPKPIIQFNPGDGVSLVLAPHSCFASLGLTLVPRSWPLLLLFPWRGRIQKINTASFLLASILRSLRTLLWSIPNENPRKWSI